MPRPRPLLAILEGSLRLMERVNLRFGRGPVRTATQQAGLDGERAAYFYLRRQGYVIVARRWRHAFLRGEVDLIGWEGDTLALIEVKTRQSRTAFAAEFRVDAAKQAALRRMAEAYVRQLPWQADRAPDVHVRFDVVSVYLTPGTAPDIRLLRDYMR